MQSIKLCSHVGADGILHLSIPTGITDKEIEVTVIYQQLEPSASPKTPEELGWPTDFFEQTAGSGLTQLAQRAGETSPRHAVL